MQQTIAVAVSGGADSLYSLISLREQGRPLVALHGVFFRERDREREAAKAAMRAELERNCRELGVPLVVLDCSEAFLERVIRPFVHSYAEGRTPNPCALCNTRIKFGLLRDAALEHGARYLASGHYARLLPDADFGHGPALIQGADSLKDQSYFLALTPGESLANALFPLGRMRKEEVLQGLAARGITPPQPGESQEVCFVPNDEYRDYVPGMAAELGIALPGPGPMLLRDGRRLGAHQGLWRYTEGQRRGLGIAWKEPLHVLAKENDGNILRLGPREEMRVTGCVCGGVNILLPPEYWPEEVLVKTRYREQPKRARARITEQPLTGKTLHICFLEAESAVAPGQIAAIYVPFATGPEEGENCLRLAAGGIIERTE